MRLRGHWLAAVALLAGIAFEAPSRVSADEAEAHNRDGPDWRWDARDEFDQCYRDRYLDSETDPGSVKLVHRIVVADEMGKGYNDFQAIKGKTQAKKILVLDDADVASATLLVGGYA
jgi:hypothetical protein